MPIHDEIGDVRLQLRELVTRETRELFTDPVVELAGVVSAFHGVMHIIGLCVNHELFRWPILVKDLEATIPSLGQSLFEMTGLFIEKRIDELAYVCASLPGGNG